MLKKSYGQHFLNDQKIIADIIDVAQIQSQELVVEVGPGGGALTTVLAERTENLVLIEADPCFIPALRSEFERAEILCADAAQVDYDAIVGDRAWIFVSNLPYNAGNAILEKVLQSTNLPKRLVVMVQKEVGERMAAPPGKMSVLSVAVQMYCTATPLFLVKPQAFMPPPKVDSLVMLLVPHAHQEPDNEKILQFVKCGFMHRRKQLRSTLLHAGVASLEKIDTAMLKLSLGKNIRPQELSVQQWIMLWRLMS